MNQRKRAAEIAKAERRCHDGPAPAWTRSCGVPLRRRYHAGDRIEVYWPACKSWYAATVIGYELETRCTRPYELLWVIRDDQEYPQAAIPNAENYRAGGEQLALFAEVA